eukprot:6196886-Pleurochrysis_carterae.AAC.1
MWTSQHSLDRISCLIQHSDALNASGNIVNAAEEKQEAMCMREQHKKLLRGTKEHANKAIR